VSVIQEVAAPVATEEGQGTPAPGAVDLRRLLLRLAAVVSGISGLAYAWYMPKRYVPDFLVYRGGGMRLFGAHLYSDHVTSLHLLFTYPPFAALLFVPLGHLSAAAALGLWSVMNAVALVGLLALTLKVCLGRRLGDRLWLVAPALTLPAVLLGPVGYDLDLGQINIFLVLMILADLTCVLGRSTKVLPRGVLVGATAAIKLTPLVFVPYLFLTKQFRAAWTALASFVVISLGMFAVAPRASWVYWTVDAWNSGRVGSSSNLSDQNLRSAFIRLGGSPHSHVLSLLTVVALVSGLALAAWAYRRSSSLLGILVCAVTGLEVSPVSWSHHYVWIIPILGWMVLSADRPRFGRWWAVLLGAVMWASPFWWFKGHTHFGFGSYVAVNSFFFCVVAFQIGVALMLWNRRSVKIEYPLLTTQP
jgi:alpha-1,2-mannosyltransferase